MIKTTNNRYEFIEHDEKIVNVIQINMQTIHINQTQKKMSILIT